MAHYIIAIDSYESDAIDIDQGETTSREQVTFANGLPKSCEVLFAVIVVDESGAHIVDDGYATKEDALTAWPHAT